MSSLLTAFSYNMEAYPELPTYPAHNTLQDDMGYVLDIDPGYILHSSLVQILSDIVLRVSDSAVIPMNVTHYGTMMRAGLAGVQKNIDSVLGANETELLKSSIEDFTKAAEDFQKQIDAKDRNNMTEFEVLEINDKLIRLSRAFIYEGGLLHRSQYRNLLIAPHPDNLNEEVVFPGLAGNLGSDPSEERVQLSRELVILVVAVKRARDILLDDFGPNLIRDEL
ncbi:aminopeptidase NAALADL1 [Aplysia californica]|uniref:Aminopeptidase NAALADL1 n=1 Tax=Aplysia californica TaxID=6500 RepID=A0ABM1AEL3_APLCA|nr:aminopeptidase NAALADL1 [Aplysia californica]